MSPLRTDKDSEIAGLRGELAEVRGNNEAFHSNARQDAETIARLRELVREILEQRLRGDWAERARAALADGNLK